VRMPGEDGTIGVGIVGLSATGGWAAGAHLPAFDAAGGFALRGLVASSEGSARAAGEAFGVPAGTSVAELAAREDVDLVVITVKVPHHRALVLPALAAGTPVLCEWPLALDLAEAEALARAAQAAGVRTFVGLQGRSAPAFRWLAQLVADGYVGEVLSATVVSASAGWGSPTSERGRYTLDRANGATLLTIGAGHALDAVAMVLGEFQALVATTATRRPQVPLTGTDRTVPMTAEDQIALSGTLAGGAVLSAHFRGGTLAGPGFSLVVDGREGTLEATAPSHPNVNPVTLRGARGAGPLQPLSLPDGHDAFPALAEDRIHALAHAYAALREDLRRGTHVVPDFAHAVTRHRLLDAITRAAATGQRVEVGP
jgi:predicted dehydrogenase